MADDHDYPDGYCNNSPLHKSLRRSLYNCRHPRHGRQPLMALYTEENVINQRRSILVTDVFRRLSVREAAFTRAGLICVKFGAE